MLCPLRIYAQTERANLLSDEQHISSRSKSNASLKSSSRPLADSMPETYVGESDSGLKNDKQKNSLYGLRALNAGRKAVGKGYQKTTLALDRFFSKVEAAPENSSSFLKADVQTTRFDINGDQEFDFRLKAKIDLSRTEKRWRLFFDSDVAEQDSLESQIRESASGDRIEQENSVAGVEFRNQKSIYLPTVNLGVKTSSGFDPYLRMRLARWNKVETDWELSWRQDLWHLGGVGWGQTSYLDILHPLSSSLSFITRSQLEYRWQETRWQFGHRWILRKVFDEDTQLQARVGHLADTDSKAVFRRHFTNVNYRKRLNGNWLFINFTPEILYDFDEKWTLEPSFTVKFEVYFTE